MLNFDIPDFLKQCGISKNPVDNTLAVDRKFLPSVKYNRKLDSFILYFPGPVGFGKQQFIFDYFDFASAYFDSHYYDRQSISSRKSFADYFLGENWLNNEKFVRIAIVFFCFNLTPSFLKKVKKSHSCLKLSPKNNRTFKSISLKDFPSFLVFYH